MTKSALDEARRIAQDKDSTAPMARAALIAALDRLGVVELSHEALVAERGDLQAARARCAELEAALREACDEAARWGHIAVGADADLLELHDALVATLARLRAVADGGAR